MSLIKKKTLTKLLAMTAKKRLLRRYWFWLEKKHSLSSSQWR